MVYPTFEFAENKGSWFPRIYLPKNYKELVSNFYKQERKEIVEEYSKLVEQSFLEKKLEIRLNWDNERGLKDINIGGSGGLNLDESGIPRFIEHNLGTETSIASGMIAMKYVSELFKSG